jgi:hypothetical protein
VIVLREIIEKDLTDTLESEFRLPVILLSPDGERQENPVILKDSAEISFVASDKSINSVDVNFFGLELNQGDSLKVFGSSSNDGTYTVSKINNKKITVNESVIDETFGVDVTLQNLTSPLVGQILYDTLRDDLEQGVQTIVHKPVVTLRRNSLTRVPISGESWFVQIPIEPKLTATKESFLLERPSEEGASIGFIRLYLMKAVQS